MGAEGNGFCKETPLSDLPPKWRDGVERFVSQVREQFSPCCIILYGSVAKGTYTVESDIDVIVIAEGLATDFWERLRTLNDLRPRGAPLEVLAYTPAEFTKMLEDYSITALDAVADGYPLYGESYFAGLERKVEELKALGLRRTAGAWRW